MNAVTPLPTQQDVRELVEGLLGRHVDAFGAHEGVKLERPDIRVVNLGRFERLPDVAALLDRLFGPAPCLPGE